MCGIVGYVGAQGSGTDPGRGSAPAGVSRLRQRRPGHPDAARTCTCASAPAASPTWPSYLRERPAPGCTGISHTRWATHGPANDGNAHPHLGGDGLRRRRPQRRHRELRRPQAPAPGRRRRLPQRHRHRGHRPADRPPPRRRPGRGGRARPWPLLKGTYGLAVVSPRYPGLIVGARLGSPLVLGIGEGEHFLASDPGALVGNTEQVVYLQDHQMCVLTPDDWHILDQDRDARRGAASSRSTGTRPTPTRASSSTTCSRRSTSSPRRWRTPCAAGSTTPTPRAHFGGLNLDAQQLRRAERIILTACGTSYHAALVGEYLFEEFARIPVEVEYASEFRYRNPPIDRNTIVIAITQSGETADTLAALRESQAQGPSDAGAVQRRRQQHRPRGRRRRLPARRPGDRRRQHQGLHQPGRRADHAGPLPRPHAAPVQPPGRAHDPRTAGHARRRAARRCTATTRCARIAEQVLPRATTSSTWAGSTSSRWRWKGR